MKKFYPRRKYSVRTGLRSLHFLLALFLLLPCHSYAEAEEKTEIHAESQAGGGVRMWEVTGIAKDGKYLSFHILGVTHNGLEVEYDDYFFKKVLPVFSRASALSAELAPLLPNMAGECPVPLAPTMANKEMIQAAREQIRSVLQAMFDRSPKAVIPGATQAEQEAIDQMVKSNKAAHAKQLAESYSEYGLVVAMNTYFQAQKNGSALYKPESKNKLEALIQQAKKETGFTDEISIRPDLVDYFRTHYPQIKVESIDAPQDVVDAYCNSRPHRELEFQHHLQRWAFNDSEAEVLQMLKDRLQFNRDLKKSIENGKMADTLSPFSMESQTGVICTRNPRWLKKMLASSLDSQNKFYALGLAHLLPREDGRNQCDTLLTMLKKEGMSVKPVSPTP
ncbi:hypothetical protein ACO0LF_14200 [Undibacterium sp. Di27W]|uniref:hypothetical protein n=1 Tax=Undibacterium sp. Di27W TaxID=3413036 RepID=UPI003BF1B832